MKKIEGNEILIIKKVFGMTAQEKRLKSKITQERLSEMIGITDVYLRCIESGKNVPNWITWLKLCTALGVDIFEIQQKYIEPCLRVDLNISDF